MGKIDRIISALAHLADAYMTEAGRGGRITALDAAVAKAKAAAVNECIELIESMDKTD